MSLWQSITGLFASLPKAAASALTPESKDKHQISITRILDAPRQKVWDAWTKPQYLSQWFGVPPITATPETTHIDLRVGGAWQADMINANDGTRVPFGGTYLEVDSPRRLVFTIVDAMNPNNPNVETVTLTMKDKIGLTEMTLHQQGHLPIDQYGEPLFQGYSAFFERLINVLRTMR